MLPVLKPAQPITSGIEDLFASVREDFAALNYLIPRELSSDVDLVEEIGRYIVDAGGKRLRPLIVLLTSGALSLEHENRIKLAAIIEFLHTATLLHDDVIDKSTLRRGRATANALWGNAPSVLVGDFLYSRAFQLMVSIGDLSVMGALADATNVIAEGEVLQLTHIGDPGLSEADYRIVIHNKTAKLFEAAAHTAALLAGADENTVRTMQRYGTHVGMAYQLIDDALDYEGDSSELGKNVGDDLAEGKMTLPLIYLLQHGTEEEKCLVRSAISERRAQDLPAIIKAVQRSGAVTYTHKQAYEESMLAISQLDVLPDSIYRTALENLARLATERRQ